MPVAPTTRSIAGRVAVIGSGLAGLTTAYLLVREGFEVFLIEKSDKLGFHSSSVGIPVRQIPQLEVNGYPLRESGHSGDEKLVSSGTSDDKTEKEAASRWIVDVPMRSFQGGYYPLLISLYKHLQLELRPTWFTFSFSHLTSSLAKPTKPQRHRTTGPSTSSSTYFIYSGGSGLSLPSLPSAAWRSSFGLISALLMVLYNAVCFIILLVISAATYHGLLGSPASSPWCLGDFVDVPYLGRLYSPFIHNILIPIFSAVGTMTSEAVLNSPFIFFAEYIHTTIGTPHYTLANASAQTVAEKLAHEVSAQGEGHLRLNEEIVSISRKNDGGEQKKASPEASLEIGFKNGDNITVDRLVVATQASAAGNLLKMLQGSLRGKEAARVSKMRDGLRQVEYTRTIVITHRDKSILPTKSDIREINLALPASPAEPHPNSSASPSSARHPETSVKSPKGDSASTTPYFQAEIDGIYTMGTHVIEPPRHLRSQVEEVYQTTNPVVPIDPATVLAISQLERALPMRNGKTFELLHPQEDGLVYLAGSYAHPGIPLLEGCVASARTAVGRVIKDLRQTTSQLESTAKDSLPQKAGTTPSLDLLGEIDWSAGQGSWLSRAWRWRRRDTIFR